MNIVSIDSIDIQTEIEKCKNDFIYFIDKYMTGEDEKFLCLDPTQIVLAQIIMEGMKNV